MFTSHQARHHLAHVEASAPAPSAQRDVLKDCVDFIMALILLTLMAPVIAIAALVVKLTSRGPAFYTQLRVGRDGRLFQVFKLRTMRHNCENLNGPQWSAPGDVRVTGVGRFLRASHVDELPQLWNIVKGEMSLVGPRPERPEFVTQLAKIFPFYGERQRVKPGLTGLAQVQVPADTDLVSVRNKLALDLQYTERHGWFMDMRILVATVFHHTGIPFANYNCVCRLPTRGDATRVYCARIQLERIAVTKASRPYGASHRSSSGRGAVPFGTGAEPCPT